MTFKDLQKASEKAKVWLPVREAILHFLETGKHPEKSHQAWPLPDTGIERSDSLRTMKPPFTDVLIEIAIHEKRTDDVMKWYDVHKQKQKYGVGEGLADDVAGAIEGKYPDRAVAIWKTLAEGKISLTNVPAYSEGARYLRRVQITLKQGIFLMKSCPGLIEQNL